MKLDTNQMLQDEWLEADGLGGFASGTVSTMRTRRYHALLLAATQPPAGRFVLVNGFDAFVETANGVTALSSQAYPADIVHPDGVQHIVEFSHEPWPRWVFALADGSRLQQEIFAVHHAAIVVVCWRFIGPSAKAQLSVRPFFSGRDYHSLHHENNGFNFQPLQNGPRLLWQPYSGVPGIAALHNGAYAHQPDWYRNFAYAEEQARGLDCTEDLATPGVFHFDLAVNEAILIFAADGFDDGRLARASGAEPLLVELRANEQRRRKQFATPMDRAADSYLVKRGKGKTIVAGYPWFTDWGRDTFISLRGLCLATERFDEARDILLEWSGVVSAGMLPNRFPDLGDQPEYNSVDASLWFIVAVNEFLAAMKARGRIVYEWQKQSLQQAVDAILTGYSGGTRYGIHMDSDGLLACGVPGSQLTWMDAKVGDWVVTPRIGKPVEVQALWLNALWIGSQFSPLWQQPFARGCESFRQRFWNEEKKCLYDVVDVNHASGQVDEAFRPNQIFALGGLPLALLDGARANATVDAVEQRLWTPLGLRSLAPGEPGYTAHYYGGVSERDGSYHQGTVWPWLIGPFVEAWLRMRGHSAAAKREARARFLAPLLDHLKVTGLGHISEIADAGAPHTPRGCPFQAWSLAEVLRLDRIVLADDAIRGSRNKVQDLAHIN